MKYFLTYNSQTGNTAILAQTIQHYLSSIPHYINVSTKEECDLLCIGFWTDKGICDQNTLEYLSTVHNQSIFLFGTAGFGGSQEYFDKILMNVKSKIDDSNNVIGTFMCQGKMPYRVKERYEQMAESNPQRFIPLIENFDEALNHPNDNDLDQLIKTIERCKKSI